MSTWVPPVQRTELIWCAVDFDGTLARSEWPDFIPGEPITENVDKLFELVDAGFKIAIHTARGWEDYELIESYLLHHRIHFDRIICGKVLARCYVDDRAIPANAESWLPVSEGE